MKHSIRGICQKCQARVPAEHVIRDGVVMLRKDCPHCGSTEALLTSDAVDWQRKRDMWHYQPTDGCGLNCQACRKSHRPNIVFIDVTNRCNMNCPICIANVPKMGFDFHPPLEYFDKIFRVLAGYDPIPMVEFFGGEPTLRDDLLILISLARKYGLKPRIVTNGLRLADEEYCRQICASRVRVRLAFDGRHPDIYRRLRKADVYEKKLRALENLHKYSVRKHALLACVARGVNDQYLNDLIQCCHEGREAIDTLGLIPLTENWEAGEFDAGLHTTREDVEHMVQACMPDEKIEFVPAGIGELVRRARSFFRTSSRSETLMFGGVHPDCESLALLISDGQRYRSMDSWLRMSGSQFAEKLVLCSRAVDARLGRLDPTKGFQRLLGQLIVIWTFLPLVRRALDPAKLFKDRPLASSLRMFAGLLRGRKFHDVAYEHMNPPRLLQLAVLPFEEPHSIESSRLENCKAAFAYEDVADGEIRTIPACLWYTYRNEILKKVAAKYGKAAGKGEWVEIGGMRFQIAAMSPAQA